MAIHELPQRYHLILIMQRNQIVQQSINSAIDARLHLCRQRCSKISRMIITYVYTVTSCRIYSICRLYKHIPVMQRVRIAVAVARPGHQVNFKGTFVFIRKSHIKQLIIHTISGTCKVRRCDQMTQEHLLNLSRMLNLTTTLLKLEHYLIWFFRNVVPITYNLLAWDLWETVGI